MDGVATTTMTMDNYEEADMDEDDGTMSLLLYEGSGSKQNEK